MKRKSFIYSDLSPMQLSYLKELFIEKKVNSMSHQELKKFALEIITHQITDTIGREEEMEAWREMSDFFGDEFETIISTIQQKYNDNNKLEEIQEDSQQYRIDVLKKNKLETEKTDMWDD